MQSTKSITATFQFESRLFLYAVCAIILVILSSGNAWATCDVSDPTGYFEGIAKGAQIPDLSISLNLRCTDGRYEGELITPVGTFSISDGDVEVGRLQLRVVVGPEKGSLDVLVDRERLQGGFVFPDAAGAVDLKRVGNSRPPLSHVTLKLSREQWCEDLEFFARELPKRHANAFHNISRRKFEAVIKDLYDRLNRRDGDTTYVDLDRIANLIGDAHTYVDLPVDRAAFPLSFARFGQEYRVIRVGPGLEKALGSVVLKIQDTPISRARDILKQLTPQAETRILADARIEGFLTTGMLLHGTGIIPTRDSVRYTLAGDNGKIFTVDVGALAASETNVRWIWAYEKRPLYRDHPDDRFWCTYLPESRAMYCNFRGYENLAKNAAELLSLVSGRQPDKLIIDMRQNSGGDFNEGFKYLINPIRNLSMINRKGHLFVIIGANTFSAAMSNATQFRQQTAAILVGQTIGEKPNSFQEAMQMTLPNSHLIVRYSTQYYKFVEGGPNIVKPDRQIAPSWPDFKAGRDPVLEWIVKYKND